jgi:hypothetical protein
MCITIKPVYDALLVLLGPEGFLFIYSDDVYMGGTPTRVAHALTEAPGIYNTVGLLLGCGLNKTEVVVPKTAFRMTFPYLETRPERCSWTLC